MTTQEDILTVCEFCNNPITFEEVEAGKMAETDAGPAHIQCLEDDEQTRLIMAYYGDGPRSEFYD